MVCWKIGICLPRFRRLQLHDRRKHCDRRGLYAPLATDCEPPHSVSNQLFFLFLNIRFFASMIQLVKLKRAVCDQWIKCHFSQSAVLAV